MSESLILLEKEKSTAIVTLNRERKRNPLSVELRNQLTSSLAQLAKDDGVKAAILTGRGPVFSAGFDTSEFMALGPEKIQAFFEASLQYHLDILTFPKPLLAAVNGPALAGGFDLALMCDFRVASDTAFFQHPEIKFGVIPLYHVLKPIVGDGWTRDICLTGRRVDAQDALRIGLINKAVPAERVLEEAKACADQIGEANLGTLIAMKKMCTAAIDRKEFSRAFKEEIVKSR
jgi:enoyl-CoA hydratase/carnithine racemase